MPHLLLTGGTGLLGAYLLRELARVGIDVTVLVRSTRREPARQRIEGLMTHWERAAGYALPRPVVLEGDLTQPSLGLTIGQRQWVHRHCNAVLHNAASLSFQADTTDGEPYQTNVEGTRNLLAFCREVGIRQFHHVSTAYVCGQRMGVIREDELDMGQEFGNDYEISKAQSERLVREADFLEPPTVYRPAIILGDSRTGYTSTFHGFYVPLKLVATLLRSTPARGLPAEALRLGVRWAGERLREILQLDGQEQKNFVPVDWVSAVIVEILSHRTHHGRTYHLTPHERTPIRLVQEVLEETFVEEVSRRSGVPREDPLIEFDGYWEQFEKFFLDGMGVYRSYWKDDPTFDASNTLAAVPHRPCPVLDATRIRRLCRFAIDSNFGWPKPATPPPPLDLQEGIDRLSQATGEAMVERIGLRVTGRGGGEWELCLAGDRVAAVGRGASVDCTATYHLNSETFRRLAARELEAHEAIVSGRVVVEGRGGSEAMLARIIEDLSTAGGR